MRLYKMELYKIYHNKAFVKAFIFSIVIWMLFFWFVGVGDEIATVNGEYYQGYEAVEKNREITEEFKGILTDQKLERIVQKYGFPKVVIKDYSGFRDANYLTNFVTEYFTDGYMRGWDEGEYRIATKLYALEETEIGKMESEIYLYYTKGWMVLLEMLQLGMVLGSIVIIVAVSRIFAEESQLSMIPLLFTTEKGKKEDTLAKMMAVFTMTFFVYAVVCTLSIALCNAVFGLDGAECSYWMVMGTGAWLTITIKEAAFMILGVNFLALFYLSAITLCVSAHVQNTFYAVIGALVCWGLPVLIRILFGGFAYVLVGSNHILLVMYECVMDMWNVLAIPIVIAVIGFLVCMIRGYLAYNRKQS